MGRRGGKVKEGVSNLAAGFVDSVKLKSLEIRYQRYFAVEFSIKPHRINEVSFSFYIGRKTYSGKSSEDFICEKYVANSQWQIAIPLIAM